MHCQPGANHELFRNTEMDIVTSYSTIKAQDFDIRYCIALQSPLNDIVNVANQFIIECFYLFFCLVAW